MILTIAQCQVITAIILELTSMRQSTLHCGFQYVALGTRMWGWVLTPYGGAGCHYAEGPGDPQWRNKKWVSGASRKI